MSFIVNLDYWLFTSYHRKKLDNDLFNSLKYFRGKILDIGAGRERGKFQHLKNKHCTVVDIDHKLKPDVVAPVEKLPFQSNSIDTIKATDLFGYVEDPDLGFKECSRVLKKGGIIILSFPYLTAFDSKQHDSQRFTEYKIRKDLKRHNFQIIKFTYQGYFFTVWSDMTRDLLHRAPLIIRYLSYVLVYPLLDLIVLLERKSNVGSFWRRYTSGFFVIARKV